MNTFDGILELMEQQFREEPFHTLQVLYGDSIRPEVPGGTCSDKALSFINEARKRGFDATIHTAFIDEKEIHRLVRLVIDGRVFFADVGNGWPSIHPYPGDEPITYSRFGITFRTELSDEFLSVYYRIEGSEKLQMRICLSPRPEEDIMAEIKARWSSDISYPFSNRMRFSAVVGEEFRFLRDGTLFIYGENAGVKRIDVDEEQWQKTLSDYFKWDVKLTSSAM